MVIRFRLVRTTSNLFPVWISLKLGVPFCKLWPKRMLCLLTSFSSSTTIIDQSIHPNVSQSINSNVQRPDWFPLLHFSAGPSEHGTKWRLKCEVFSEFWSIRHTPPAVFPKKGLSNTSWCILIHSAHPTSWKVCPTGPGVFIALTAAIPTNVTLVCALVNCEGAPLVPVSNRCWSDQWRNSNSWFLVLGNPTHFIPISCASSVPPNSNTINGHNHTHTQPHT